MPHCRSLALVTAQVSAGVGEVDAYSVTGAGAAGELAPYSVTGARTAEMTAGAGAAYPFAGSRRRIGDGRLGHNTLDQWSRCCMGDGK